MSAMAVFPICRGAGEVDGLTVCKRTYAFLKPLASAESEAGRAETMFRVTLDFDL